MKSNTSGACVVDSNALQSETFGSNIHELFTNTFFLEDGLMGEFAKDKLQKTISWLNDKNDLRNADMHKKLISIIGEPIVKVKLSEMYSDKMGLNVELAILEAQQEYIQERLSKLRKNDKNSQ